MKRILCLLLCLCCLVSVAGCNAEDVSEPSEQLHQTDGQETETTNATEATNTTEVTTTTDPTLAPETITKPERPAMSKERVKILAIGNSFSDNAMKYMYSILQAFGAKEIVLGNMYIGGCTLVSHYNYAVHDVPRYQYRKNDSRTPQAGNFTNTEKMTLSFAVTDEDWDVVTVQQASDFSGVLATYKTVQLDYLADFIKSSVNNEDVVVGWHMTWAYAATSTHAAFPTYNRDQMTMYNAICECVKEKVLPNANIDFIIPAGTAIQNARTSYIGDNLTADGYHLNALGEYIAGLTWVLEITGWSIEDLNLDYVPAMFRSDIEMIKESALNALENPYTITQSEYTQKG